MRRVPASSTVPEPGEEAKNDVPEALLQDLPSALEQVVQRTYSDPVLARRALLAPWPEFGFRSAYEMRDLWREGRRLSKRQDEERHRLCRTLTVPLAQLQTVDQVFFVALGTGGTLRSPYPEMRDADYWLFVTLWESEKAARAELERPIAQFKGKNTVQVWADAQKGLEQISQEQARREQYPPDLIQRLAERLGLRNETPDLPPDLRLSAWNYHVQQVSGNYT